MKFEVGFCECPYCKEDRIQVILEDYNDFINASIECSDCGYHEDISLYCYDIMQLLEYNVDDFVKNEECDWDEERRQEFLEYKRAWEYCHKKPYFERSL